MLFDRLEPLRHQRITAILVQNNSKVVSESFFYFFLGIDDCSTVAAYANAVHCTVVSPAIIVSFCPLVSMCYIWIDCLDASWCKMGREGGGQKLTDTLIRECLKLVNSLSKPGKKLGLQ